jgi:hypothetical protein
MRVKLFDREVRLAACAALERRLEWMREGRAERYESAGARGLGADFVGCLAEVAVSKWLGRYAHGLGYRAAQDVERVEVRAIDQRGHALPVYPRDPDDAAFVLAFVGDVYREGVEVVGWLPGSECKSSRFWDASHKAAAYLVPQAYLRPAVDLVPFLEGGE